jgi:fucose permease
MDTAVAAEMSASEATAARRPVRRVLVIGLLAVGLLGSVVGPALPGIRATFGLSLGDAGLAVVAGAVGYIVGAMGGGLLADRRDRRGLVLLAGGLLVAGAVGVVLAPAWPLLLASLALFGGGGGLLDGPGNAMVNEHSGEWRTADLNLAHGFFGVGSVVGPLVAGLALAAGIGWNWLVVPGLLAAGALLAFSSRLRLPPRRAVAPHHDASWRVLRQPLVLLLAAILCLYVGVEMMIGTWAFSHLRLDHGAGNAVAGLATALYWGGLTAGRLLAGTVGARVGPHTWIVSNGVGSALALALLVAAPTLPLAVGGLALAGLALANIFPAVVAIGGAAYPAAGGTVSGALAAAGGIGGALVPWGAGLLAERFGLGSALAAGVALLVLLLLAEAGVIALTRRQAAARTETNPDAALALAGVPVGPGPSGIGGGEPE